MKKINFKQQKHDKKQFDRDSTPNIKSTNKSIIDIMTDADYKNKSFELQKKIDDEFDFDYEKIIMDFINDNVDDKEYNNCINIKNKFNSKLIYEVKNQIDMEDAIIKHLDESEKKILSKYKKYNKKINVDEFLNYIDELIADNSPYVEVQVANSKQNYNHLSKYIKTVVNKSIYKGIKIIYKNKVYDFSLNERNV